MRSRAREGEVGGVPQNFRLLHHFTLASFVSILAVAFLILMFYRYLVINTITELGKTVDLSLAQTVLHTITPELSSYLDELASTRKDNPKRSRVSGTQLAKDIDRFVDGSGIAKIKVYDRHGTVVYSTDPLQIGRNQIDNLGYRLAMKGSVASKLIYRDRFNPFDLETSDDNLIQTYLPVKANGSDGNIGVFEIYTDANILVREAEQSQLIVVPVVIGILSLLYFVLFGIVRRANGIITQQKSTLTERSRTLEVLTAKLLNAQEEERKRLAVTLHEGVAQNLSAIKINLQNTSDQTAARDTLITLIQGAIDQTRNLALDLRPSSLDDFGVKSALTDLMRETESRLENVSLIAEFKVEEEQLPKPLKTLIFRITQDTLRNLLKETEADRIKVSLRTVGDSVALSIMENSSPYTAPKHEGTSTLTLNDAIIPMRERTLLSGGDFRSERSDDGLTNNVAVWPV